MKSQRADVQQLKDHLRARIIRAELPEGARIHAEELRQATGATVRVVRQALNELAHEGLLQRRQRLGTFVSRGVARAGTSPLPAVRALAVVSSLRREALRATEFPRDALEGMETVMAQPRRIEFCTNYHPQSLSIHTLPPIETELLKSLVQGVIAIEANNVGALNELARAGLPVVALDFHHPEAAFDAVQADYEEAGFQAALHLIALGHRKLAFVGERANPNSNDPAWQQRMGGFFRATGWAGGETPRPLVLGGPRDPTHLERDLPGFHARHRPTAYVLASGSWAAELVRVLGLQGLECPRDYSLVCADPSSRVLGRLSFSYVRVDYMRAGKLAVQLIASRLACRAMPPVKVTIPVSIIPGNSSRGIASEVD